MNHIFKRQTLFRLGAIAAVLLVSRQSAALDFDLAGVHGELDNRLAIGAAWRVAKPDPKLIGIANGGQAYSTNGDDGDLAWGRGLVYGGARLTSALSLTHGDSGLFTRGSFGSDAVLQSKQLFDSNDYDDSRVTRGYTQADRLRKQSDTKAHDAHYAEFRDLYAYTNQTVLDHSVSLRVGKQVVNWGESTLVLNGLNSLLAIDANRARLPGMELDEIIIPSNQVWASVNLTDKLSAEAFYQLQWQRTIIDASGTYFSTNDFAGIGGTAANLGFGRVGENIPACPAPSCSVYAPYGSYVPRAADVTPSNAGQFGGALRTHIDALNDMELALYAATYHSRLPLYSGTSRTGPGLTPATTASYFAEYPKDIRMYGVSFNTSLPWDLALQGEYSFKQGQPLQIDDVELLLAGLGAPSQINPTAGATLGGQYLRGWRRKDVSQADIGLTRIFGPNRWIGSEQTVALLEAAVTHVHNLEDQSVLRYEGPGTYTPGDAATAAGQGVPQQTQGYATPTSYGYKLLLRTDYNNVFDRINLKPTLRWDQDLKGITPTPIANFVAGRRQLTAGLGYTYGGSISGDIAYTRFIGAGTQNLLRDRDYVEAVLKYSF